METSVIPHLRGISARGSRGGGGVEKVEEGERRVRKKGKDEGGVVKKGEG